MNKKFDMSFRGYDKEQVDSYFQELTLKYDSTLATQKDRIFSLVDENSQLQEELRQYKIDEKAISKSLVESQKLAGELKYDAEKFAQLTLSRAKIFYATWQSYAKTLLATLTDQEVKQFNILSDKIASIINAFEGKQQDSAVLEDVIAASVANGHITVQDSTVTAAPTDTDCGTVTGNNQGEYSNPIARVQEVAGQSIDPRELLTNNQTLEELCRELGLIS